MKGYDVRTSEKIHQMKHSWSMDYCLYLPAVAFNGPVGVLIMCCLVSFFFTAVERDMIEVKRKKRMEAGTYEQVDLTPEQQFMEDLELSKIFVATYYLLNVVAVLMTTTFLKKYFARPRPPQPDYTNEETVNRRTFDLRSCETNFSFPSGDSA